MVLDAIGTFAMNNLKHTCAHCSYDLAGLSEPRCPECGLQFDPAGSAPVPHHFGAQFVLIVGTFCGIAHLVLSFVLFSFAVGSGQVNSMNTPFAKSLDVILTILLWPGSWFIAVFNASNQIMFFCFFANSLLWGYCLALGFLLVGNSRHRMR